MSNSADRAMTEAAEWFARRRRGVMTLRERTGYEQWSRDPANCAAMSEMEKLWALAGLSSAELNTRPAPQLRLSAFARAALVAILCVASLGAGIISFASHSEFWTRLDWTEK